MVALRGSVHLSNLTLDIQLGSAFLGPTLGSLDGHTVWVYTTDVTLLASDAFRALPSLEKLVYNITSNSHYQVVPPKVVVIDRAGRTTIRSGFRTAANVDKFF